MTADDFDLAAEVERIADETGLSDPGDIAGKVLENMTTEQLKDVAFALLRNWVRLHLGRIRVSPVRPSVQAETTGRKVGARNSARRRNQLTAADRLERALSGRFTYNGLDWGRTGDLTVEQCRSIASSYTFNASILAEHGVNWDALAEQMVTDGVTRVRDLSADVLHAFFAPEAVAA
jgi:hypothetical protein